MACGDDAVGAGTSGAVFASRLTEDDNRTVLILEAGGDPFDDQNVNIPILADSVRGTEYDWIYHTVPQQHACFGHVNNVRHRASSLSITALQCSEVHSVSFAQIPSPGRTAKFTLQHC